MSRARLAVLSSVLLLALDAGRSYYARVGYAHPSELWQPDSSDFADLTWPPGADARQDLPLGRRVYAQR